MRFHLSHSLFVVEGSESGAILGPVGQARVARSGPYRRAGLSSSQINYRSMCGGVGWGGMRCGTRSCSRVSIWQCSNCARLHAVSICTPKTLNSFI